MSSVENLSAWKLKTLAGQPHQLLPVLLEAHPASLNSASRQIPGGVYTTFRTYYRGSRVLQLDAHIRRLEESASLLGIQAKLDRQMILDTLGKLIRRQPPGDSRIRLTLALEEDERPLYFLLEPLAVPDPIDYQHGVKVVTVPYSRENPNAKQTSFIEIADSIRQNLPAGINEAVLTSPDGRLLEGLTSNIFAVRAGELWTAGEGVLHGITRSMILDAAGRLGLAVHLKGFPILELPSLDEAFLTSASRSVLPVSSINAIQTRQSVPGPVTSQVSTAFDQLLEEQLVEI